MIDQVREILNNDVEVIIKSPLSLSLLKVYSILYLGGKQPRVCERSQRNYYYQIQKDGIMKAELIEKIKNRTCELKGTGLVYSRVSATHYSSETIHDELAIEALTKGYLVEAHFKVLPEGYKKESEPKKRGRKPKQAE